MHGCHCVLTYVREVSIKGQATMQVHQVSKGYLYAHHQLLDEFRNATHWPKHLLVQYSWQAEQEVDALSALYVVFAVCELPPATRIHRHQLI